MKKIYAKFNDKKVKYTVGTIIIFILLIADAKCSQSFPRMPKESQEVTENIVIESEIPEESEEPEPSFQTYEELQSNYERDINDSGKMIEEIDDTVSGTYEDTKDKDSNLGKKDNQDRDKSKAVIIDESDETMKDETKGDMEKEYDPENEPQGKIDWSPQKPEKDLGGREEKIVVKPGGKKGVGIWS